MFPDIQAIFFDLGDTLVCIKPRILQTICETLGRVRKEPLVINEYMIAFQTEWGNRKSPLDTHLIKDVDTHEEEVSYWQGFFQPMLKSLGIPHKHKSLIEAIARTYADSDSFECFEDVHPVLNELSKSYKLGLISNAFPSAEKIIDDLGLRNYFTHISLSFQLPSKTIKPEPEIYTAAIKDVNVEIKNTLFVDDRWPFVKAAIELGMNAYLIERFYNRDQSLHTKSVVRTIHDLYELEREIWGETNDAKRTSTYSNKKKDDGDTRPRIIPTSSFAVP